MKRKTKRILVVVGIVLLLAACVAAYFLYPMLIMTPAETGAIADTGIVAVRNARNAVYFIDTGEGTIMVDAGSDVKSLSSSMEGVGVSTEDVKWILLTHSDYDHVAALPLFPDAEIYVSEDEMPLLDGNADAFSPLTDGFELDLGGTQILCISSPGHTVGSMSYLVDGRYLFTGDAFMVSGSKMDVHPFTRDEALAASSIEKLAETADDAELVLTGHYGYFSGSSLER